LLNFNVLRIVATVVTCVLSATLAAPPVAAARIDKATGLTVLYAEKVAFADYASNHPLLSGTWIYKRETATHWIGSLSYPTDNAMQTSNDYLYEGVKVRKTRAFDLGKGSKKTPQTVVLLKQTILAAPSEIQPVDFQLVAYNAAGSQTTNFLFGGKFPFAPKQITGVLKRHQSAHTKRSMLTGNYHIYTRLGPVEVLTTQLIPSEMLDKLHNKKVTASGAYRGKRKLIVNGNELVQRPAAPAGGSFDLRPAFTPDKIVVAK